MVEEEEEATSNIAEPVDLDGGEKSLEEQPAELVEEDPIPVKEEAIRDHVGLLYFARLSTQVEQAEIALSVIEMEMEPMAKEETVIETSF